MLIVSRRETSTSHNSSGCDELQGCERAPHTCPARPGGGEGVRRQSLEERTQACGKPISTPQLAGSLTLPRCQGHCWPCLPLPREAKLYLREQPGTGSGAGRLNTKETFPETSTPAFPAGEPQHSWRAWPWAHRAQTRWQDGRRLSPGSSKDRTRRSS